MTEQTAIPDVERAAVTVLARAERATHPVLAAWVRRIAADPAYRGFLGDPDLWTPAALFPNAADRAPVDVRAWLDARGYASDPDRLLADLADQRAFTGVLAAFAAGLVDDPFPVLPPDWGPDPAWGDDPLYLAHLRILARRDARIARLAAAVVLYRHDGRPTGDVDDELRYGDAAIARVTTSLAAAVAEHAADLADDAPAALERWRDERRGARLARNRR